MPLLYRRVTTMTEYYREASLSVTVQQWHERFAADKAEQRASLADVFFAGTVHAACHALCESIFALLEKHGVQRDVLAACSEPGCYVTEPVWRPQSTVGAKGGKAANVTSSSRVATQLRAEDAPRTTGISHVKPSERELEKTLKRDKRD